MIGINVVGEVMLEQIRQLYQVNNSVIFSGKPIASEEFIIRVVEALGIIIALRDRLSKEDLIKENAKP